MATFGECISEEVAAGSIDPEIGHAAKEAYDNAFESLAPGLGAQEADRQAARQTMDALEKAAIEARRRKALAERTRMDILGAIEAQKTRRGYGGDFHGGGPNGDPPGLGGQPPANGPFQKGAAAARMLPLLMRNKGGLSGAPLKGSLEGRKLAISGLFDARMADIMEKFQSRTGFDTPNRAHLINIVREAFGEETGDQASKDLARSWSETAEMARQLFNQAGGAIGRVDRWGLPQSHDAAAIYRAGRDAWVEFTQPLLDRAKMVDKLTGAPFTAKRLAVKLGDTYDRIVTRGLTDRDPGEGTGRGSLATQRGEERFLDFRDADAWRAYQARFGDADAYSAMVGHLDDMASDISRMQILGPNPDHQFEWLKAMATREAAVERLNGAEGAERAARSAIKRAQDMYDAFTGKSSMPVDERLARWGATSRAYLNGVNLGSAILTDMPSAPMFGAMARAFMGVRLQGDMGQLAALLADPSMRAEARRMGFINEVARDGLVSATQDSLRSLTAGEKPIAGMGVFARKLPTAVMRLQGLSGAFEARRRSFRLSFMGALADAGEKSLPDLAAGSAQEKALARELASRAFTSADWDAIRATPAWTPRPGVRFLRPQDIEQAAGSELALRVGEMVLNGEQYAVPVSSSLWTRAWLLGGHQPGTIKGEFFRSFWLYKTFLINAHYMYSEELFLRGLERAKGNELGGRAWQITWAAGMLGMLTLSGGVTLQLAQIASGEDPWPMTTPDFWARALLRGGGLGLLGEFFHAHRSAGENVSGMVDEVPIGRAFHDAWNLTGQELIDIANRDRHPNAPDHEADRIAQDMAIYTPLARVWWARSAFRRAIVDQLLMSTDPDAKIAFERRAQRINRQDGVGVWWPAGAATPERAPNLGNAAQQPPR